MSKTDRLQKKLRRIKIKDLKKIVDNYVKHGAPEAIADEKDIFNTITVALYHDILDQRNNIVSRYKGKDREKANEFFVILFDSREKSVGDA